jgi:PEP-CTERM motif
MIGERLVAPTALAAGSTRAAKVTGESQTTGDAANHVFLYDPVRGMVDLNALIDPTSGWSLEFGTAINDRGQITGWGVLGGQEHAFLLTTVPEPSTFVLAGLGAIGVLRYFRRAPKTVRMHYDFTCLP